jgi:hypothetical protein
VLALARLAIDMHVRRPRRRCGALEPELGHAPDSAIAALRSGSPLSAAATSCAWRTVTEDTSTHNRPASELLM